MKLKHKFIFHGHLKDKYGDCFQMAVISPAAAIRMFMAQLKDFKQYFRDGLYKVVINKDVNDEGIELEHIHMHLSQLKTQTVHIVPCLQGEGGGDGGGIGKIILGGLIMIAAVAATVFTGGVASGVAGAAFWGTGWGATAASTAFYIGLSIALSGLAMLLQPSVETVSAESPESKPSFFLSSPINMVEQGGAIPVCYGEFTCGSCTVNASMHIYDIL